MDQPQPRILVVDDDPDILVLLQHRLEQLGYAVRTATHGPEALNKLASEQPALILLDLRLPRLSGLDVLQQIKQVAPEVTVIVMTAYASVEKAVEAMKAGAFDFLTKPLTPGHLELVVQKAFERQALERAQHLLQVDLDGKTQPIIGDSPALRHTIDRARRAAQSPATVLLLGESGTGKEVFARAIHAWSPRRTRPFVVINCAALSDELIASDLFGHEKGSFTGAYQRKPGKLELAAGGTVFFDEVGELPATLQSRLLRVLQEHTFERVGDAHHRGRYPRDRSYQPRPGRRSHGRDLPGRFSFSVSTSSPSPCHRCGSVRKTFRSSRSVLYRNIVLRSRGQVSASHQRRSNCCNIMTGLATYGNSRTSSNVPWSSATLR